MWPVNLKDFFYNNESINNKYYSSFNNNFPFFKFVLIGI
jgi:hypothetical protein